MKYKHMVVYVGRSSVFTDRRFTEKLHNTLHTHEEHGWELVNFFKRPAYVEEGLADDGPPAEDSPKQRRIA
jgi:hypothetical protein